MCWTDYHLNKFRVSGIGKDWLRLSPSVGIHWLPHTGNKTFKVKPGSSTTSLETSFHVSDPLMCCLQSWIHSVVYQVAHTLIICNLVGTVNVFVKVGRFWLHWHEKLLSCYTIHAAQYSLWFIPSLYSAISITANSPCVDRLFVVGMQIGRN